MRLSPEPPLTLTLWGSMRVVIVMLECCIPSKFLDYMSVVHKMKLNLKLLSLFVVRSRLRSKPRGMIIWMGIELGSKSCLYPLPSISDDTSLPFHFPYYFANNNNPLPRDARRSVWSSIRKNRNSFRSGLRQMDGWMSKISDTTYRFLGGHAKCWVAHQPCHHADSQTRYRG